MEIVLIVVLGVVLLVVVGFIVSYNRFVGQRNTIAESWRQVDVELQRRHDLIPNLVESVKASARFEQATLQQVMQARAQAMQARQSGAGLAAQGHAEQQLSGALRGFFGLAESYPELKASQNFLHLQQQLAETEDRIAAGRRFYNGNVRAYNTRIGQFPSSVIAGMFKFTVAEYFEVDDPDVRATPSLAGAFDELATPPMGQPQLAPPQPHMQQPHMQQPHMQQSYMQPNPPQGTPPAG
jgi:LemA protein